MRSLHIQNRYHFWNCFDKLLGSVSVDTALVPLHRLMNVMYFSERSTDDFKVRFLDNVIALTKASVGQRYSVWQSDVWGF